MRIDRRLNLVIPIYDEGEGSDVVAYVHSTPLAEEIVEQFFMVLGQTYNQIFSNGLGITAGPGNAMRVLRHIAIERDEWNDDPRSGRVGVERGLVAEMKRLSNVAALGKDGKWEQLPLDVAVDRGVISQEDRREVENAIAFFIVISATLNRAQRPAMLRAAAGLWGARIESLPFTEFWNSLRTSTGTVSSGETSLAPAKDEPASANAVVAGKPSSVPV